MESSDNDSSNVSTPINTPPGYFRLSSEVVEKPCSDDIQENSTEYHFISAPTSPATSNKSDSDGCSDTIQGDVDEGFDEEFEDKDNVNETELTNAQINFEGLDPKDLQQLLGDSLLPNLLEDFDLGVDILDSEQTLSPSSVMSSCSSSYHNVHSPFQSSPHMPASPVFMQLQMNQYNEKESTQEGNSLQDNVTTVDRGRDDDDTLVVPENSVQQQRHPDSTTNEPQHFSEFSSVYGLVDLSETTRLLSADTFDFSSVLPSDGSVDDTQSMYMFGIGTGQLGISSNNSPSPITTLESHVTTDSLVTTLMDSSMFTDVSEPVANIIHDTFPPSPPYTLSPSPSSVDQDTISEEDKKLIDMPYYQFRKMLDDPSIPERKKESIKNTRRRGRNKMAAKVCRQKKLNMIMGLEQEIQLLRKKKIKMSIKSKTLEKEIAKLKGQCSNR